MGRHKHNVRLDSKCNVIQFGHLFWNITEAVTRCVISNLITTYLSVDRPSPCAIVILPEN